MSLLDQYIRIRKQQEEQYAAMGLEAPMAKSLTTVSTSSPAKSRRSTTTRSSSTAPTNNPVVTVTCAKTEESSKTSKSSKVLMKQNSMSSQSCSESSVIKKKPLSTSESTSKKGKKSSVRSDPATPRGSEMSTTKSSDTKSLMSREALKSSGGPRSSEAAKHLRTYSPTNSPKNPRQSNSSQSTPRRVDLDSFPMESKKAFQGKGPNVFPSKSQTFPDISKGRLGQLNLPTISSFWLDFGTSPICHISIFRFPRFVTGDRVRPN